MLLCRAAAMPCKVKASRRFNAAAIAGLRDGGGFGYETRALRRK
jgi:hypothetical protein